VTGTFTLSQNPDDVARTRTSRRARSPRTVVLRHPWRRWRYSCPLLAGILRPVPVGARADRPPARPGATLRSDRPAVARALARHLAAGLRDPHHARLLRGGALRSPRARARGDSIPSCGRSGSRGSSSPSPPRSSSSWVHRVRRDRRTPSGSRWTWSSPPRTRRPGPSCSDARSPSCCGTGGSSPPLSARTRPARRARACQLLVDPDNSFRAASSPGRCGGGGSRRRGAVTLGPQIEGERGFRLGGLRGTSRPGEPRREVREPRWGRRPRGGHRLEQPGRLRRVGPVGGDRRPEAVARLARDGVRRLVSGPRGGEVAQGHGAVARMRSTVTSRGAATAARSSAASASGPRPSRARVIPRSAGPRRPPDRRRRPPEESGGAVKSPRFPRSTPESGSSPANAGSRGARGRRSGRRPQHDRPAPRRSAGGTGTSGDRPSAGRDGSPRRVEERFLEERGVVADLDLRGPETSTRSPSRTAVAGLSSSRPASAATRGQGARGRQPEIGSSGEAVTAPPRGRDGVVHAPLPRGGPRRRTGPSSPRSARRRPGAAARRSPVPAVRVRRSRDPCLENEHGAVARDLEFDLVPDS